MKYELKLSNGHYKGSFIINQQDFYEIDKTIKGIVKMYMSNEKHKGNISWEVKISVMKGNYNNE